MVKEFYSNARFTGVELRCWVRGKEFIITPDYLAKILHISSQELQIDICAHVFQTIGKTAAQTAAQMCLPFCSLLMKIMIHEGVFPPKDGKFIVRHHPISITSLQKSKSHSFAEWKMQNLSTTPKSEFVQHVNHSGHGSAAHPTPGHTEPISPHIPEPQIVSTQPTQSSSHADPFTI